jgi:hypothetical protein
MNHRSSSVDSRSLHGVKSGSQMRQKEQKNPSIRMMVSRKQKFRFETRRRERKQGQLATEVEGMMYIQPTKRCCN